MDSNSMFPSQHENHADDARMTVRFWGVRGSVASPGIQTLHFGGNTSCVEVRCGAEVLILDGGTGLRSLGDALRREGVRRGLLLFSHVHWDHIQGFPFFMPGYDPRGAFEILGGDDVLGSLHEVLHRQMRPPNFPKLLQEMGAQFTFHPVRSGDGLLRGEVEIRAVQLRHPNPSYGYRIQYRGASLVYATDTEHPSDGTDSELVAFARAADLLIYDAQFTTEEYEGSLDGRPRRGWGHSTPQEGAKLAAESEVGCLALYHHDPSHDDETIRRMERQARAIFPQSLAAHEGLVLHLGGGMPCVLGQIP
jgi:phosphoribosyl 1,2-cyclic phosphodiesterase